MENEDVNSTETNALCIGQLVMAKITIKRTNWGLE